MPYIGKKPADIIATAVDTTTGTFSGDIITATAGTSNFRAGVNAGNSITSGGNYNTVVGDEAGTAITTGDNNVAVGYNALATNSTASTNIAVGYQAAYSNATGVGLTAFGANTLYATTASDNCGIGTDNPGNYAAALESNTTGRFNTAVATGALGSNTEGQHNTALGHSALAADTLGSRNTAIGYQTLDAQNFTGATNSNNTALGYAAGSAVSTGIDNTLLGARAGLVLSDADYNVAVGMGALVADTKGSKSTAIGVGALEVQNFTSSTDAKNTAVGYKAGSSVVDGSLNGTFIGTNSGLNTTGNKNQFFGANAGSEVTSGGQNVILGRYNGNQGGLDIRTSSNNIVLADGDGVPRVMVNSSGYFHASANVADSEHYNSTNFSSISTSNTQPALFVENSGDGNVYGMIIDFTDATPDNNTSYFLGCQDNTAIRLKIWGDGDVQNHDNSYSGLSDVKLKEQITDASSQWDDIKALTIRKYKMKTDVATGDSDAHWRLGVVAQEVETAGMNGLVRDNPDLITNSDGEIEESGTTTKSVKYSILYMKAVKALQEAMTRIETLESKVATLEG